MEVAGVDGCPAGWVIVWAQADGSLRILSASTAGTFADVLTKTRQCTAVGIDIPIGLATDHARSADVEARRVLRAPRASSVFPAPVYPVLSAVSYRDACDVSFRVWRKKLSKQNYALLNKIRDVNEGMTPDLQRRVVEVHPEVCFWALNGCRPIANSKRTEAGALERVALLSAEFVDDVSAIRTPSGVARDDLLDACAAAWTAARYARGEAQQLPEEPRLDARGLRMEIIY